jgi:hypothetical protein
VEDEAEEAMVGAAKDGGTPPTRPTAMGGMTAAAAAAWGPGSPTLPDHQVSGNIGLLLLLLVLPLWW